jgi:hypothetical protein
MFQRCGREGLRDRRQGVSAELVLSPAILSCDLEAARVLSLPY